MVHGLSLPAMGSCLVHPSCKPTVGAPLDEGVVSRGRGEGQGVRGLGGEEVDGLHGIVSLGTSAWNVSPQAEAIPKAFIVYLTEVQAMALPSGRGCTGDRPTNGTQ